MKVGPEGEQEAYVKVLCVLCATIKADLGIYFPKPLPKMQPKNIYSLSEKNHPPSIKNISSFGIQFVSCDVWCIRCEV